MSDQKPVALSDEDVQRIAEATRDAFMKGIYQDVGRGVVRKLIWIAILAGILGVAYWDRILAWLSHGAR